MSIDDYSQIFGFLESIGIKKIGYAVNTPVQSLFIYKNSTHSTMIACYPNLQYLLVNYTYSVILENSPINILTGMGTFKEETIFRSDIESIDHLKSICLRYNIELFRDQIIDDILSTEEEL